MLESAEIGHKVPKRVYAREEPKLRELLLNAQFDLSQSGRGPLLLVISGVEGGGRGETANKLTEWMDPRHIHVVAFGPRAPEEAARPPAWRYWRSLPPKGKIGILMNAWYNESMLAHVQGKIDADQVNTRVQAIREHEQMLTDEGFVLLKFWIHLSKAAQKQRLQELEHDPTTAWRVTREDWKTYRIYNKAHELWESLLRETSTGAAPWHVVEGTDGRYRYLTVGKILLDALRTTLAPRPATPKHAITPPAPSVIDNVKLIRDLDLSKKLPVKDYDRALEKHQGKLATLTRHKRFAKRSLILVFEGVDAAGKGGAIRRVTGALDARQYVTVPVAAPTEEERAFPYLWRFWRNVPRYGGITIFDRSWYGRVLVERVEGLATEEQWRRAYQEIVEFEESLVAESMILVKFWMHISNGEQLRRFESRRDDPLRVWKLTDEDWRNRKKRKQYERAVEEMLARTSHDAAPWHLVEADDKRYARVKVIETVCRSIKDGMAARGLARR